MKIDIEQSLIESSWDAVEQFKRTGAIFIAMQLHLLNFTELTEIIFQDSLVTSKNERLYSQFCLFILAMYDEL